MNTYLVVIKPFGRLVRGDTIKDPAQIAQVLAGDHAHAVVRVAASSNREV
jgi:hypothetical protein